MSRRAALLALGFVTGVWGLTAGLTASPAPAQAQPQTPAAVAAPATKPSLPSDAEIEEFLLKARPGKTRGAGKGITGSLRMTMTYENLTHDVHIQTIDESKREFKSARARSSTSGTTGASTSPATRSTGCSAWGLFRSASNGGTGRVWLRSRGGSTTFMMDEQARYNKKISPPAEKLETWNQQMQMLRLFDQLIANTDRNLGNLLIGNDWTIWAIDHTRAFRTHATLKTPGNVTRCDREVFARLKQLDKPTLSKAVGHSLQGYEIEAILKRRDAIVTIIEQKGDSGLFDRIK